MHFGEIYVYTYTHFIHEAKRQDPHVLLKLSCYAHPEIVCNFDKEGTGIFQQWSSLLLSTPLIKIYLEVCLRDSQLTFSVTADLSLLQLSQVTCKLWLPL